MAEPSHREHQHHRQTDSSLRSCVVSCIHGTVHVMALADRFQDTSLPLSARETGACPDNWLTEYTSLNSIKYNQHNTATFCCSNCARVSASREWCSAESCRSCRAEHGGCSAAGACRRCFGCSLECRRGLFWAGCCFCCACLDCLTLSLSLASWQKKEYKFCLLELVCNMSFLIVMIILFRAVLLYKMNTKPTDLSAASLDTLTTTTTV